MEANGFDFVSLGVELGSGTALGFIAGYATKKLVKLAAIIAGLFIAALKFLEMRGIVETVHWGELIGLAPAVPENADASQGIVESITGVLPFSGGFAVGFAVGMKRG